MVKRSACGDINVREVDNYLEKLPFEQQQLPALCGSWSWEPLPGWKRPSNGANRGSAAAKIPCATSLRKAIT